VALEESGYELLEAESGAAALDMIGSDESISGLITDIRVGEGPSGWEVAREARFRFPGLPIVYMTGDSAADWTAEGVPNSILVQKPFLFTQVVTAISTLLNGPIAQVNDPKAFAPNTKRTKRPLSTHSGHEDCN
jgi:DNA-binding response OmpR family regulator